MKLLDPIEEKRDDPIDEIEPDEGEQIIDESKEETK